MVHVPILFCSRNHSMDPSPGRGSTSSFGGLGARLWWMWNPLLRRNLETSGSMSCELPFWLVDSVTCPVSYDMFWKNSLVETCCSRDWDHAQSTPDLKLWGRNCDSTLSVQDSSSASPEKKNCRKRPVAQEGHPWWLPHARPFGRGAAPQRGGEALGGAAARLQPSGRRGQGDGRDLGPLEITFQGESLGKAWAFQPGIYIFGWMMGGLNIVWG